MTNQRKRLQLAFVSYFVCVLGVAILPPIVDIWNRVTPHVLGLPFSQFVILALAVLLSVGLVAWYDLDGRLDQHEAALRAGSSSRDQ